MKTARAQGVNMQPSSVIWRSPSKEGGILMSRGVEGAEWGAMDVILEVGNDGVLAGVRD